MLEESNIHWSDEKKYFDFNARLPGLILGALGDKKDEGGSSGAREIDPEVEEALREAEQKRQEKHRKMEEEREAMRQDIRDKVRCFTHPIRLFI